MPHRAPTVLVAVTLSLAAATGCEGVPPAVDDAGRDDDGASFADTDDARAATPDAPAPDATDPDATTPDASAPDDGSEAGAGDAGCVSSPDYFATRAWPAVFSRCVRCHVPGGESAGTRFVLRPEAVSGYLAMNFDVVRAAAALSYNGRPLLELKATGMIAHGGMTVIAAGSPEHQVLRATLEQFARPIVCEAPPPPPPPPPEVLSGLTLLDAEATLRRVSLQLAGRVPTEAERAQVRTAGLDAVLRPMMREAGFHDRIMEVFNDVLMTDRSLTAISYVGAFFNINERVFPSRDYAGPTWMAPGRRVADSVAREPLEMIAHIVMNDRPLSEIVTARYRLVNPLSARVYGLTVPFADPTDINEWREVQIPGMHAYAPGQSEYAGVLTTPAFLYVVTGASTNRNRRRARYVYPWFLNQDIMRTASRIDFSTVDFTSNPWLNNPACTACHARLDPVAGLFQNWTNCYDSPYYQYFQPGMRYCGRSSWWGRDTMFPPGLRQGHEMPAEEIPRALEHLAASIVADPGFAQAMVRHLFAGLMGRPILDAPQNTSDPDFAALQRAYDTQRAALDAMATDFAAHGFDTKRLVVDIVRSPYFRASDVDTAGRAELAGVGGGALTAPEVLHRRIVSILGQGWGEAGNALREDSPSVSPYYLRGFDKARFHAGGVDSRTPGQRLLTPSGLTGSVSARMAYEMACRVVPLDFTRAPAARRLFPYVERTAAPSGDPTAADQQAIVRNLVLLHDLLLGERLAPDAPELRASYALLTQLYADGRAQVAMGRTTDLGPCRATTNYATGQSVPGGFTDDPATHRARVAGPRVVHAPRRPSARCAARATSRTSPSPTWTCPRAPASSRATTRGCAGAPASTRPPPTSKPGRRTRRAARACRITPAGAPRWRRCTAAAARCPSSPVAATTARAEWSPPRVCRSRARSSFDTWATPRSTPMGGPSSSRAPCRSSRPHTSGASRGSATRRGSRGPARPSRRSSRRAARRGASRRSRFRATTRRCRPRCASFRWPSRPFKRASPRA